MQVVWHFLEPLSVDVCEQKVRVRLCEFEVAGESKESES